MNRALKWLVAGVLVVMTIPVIIGVAASVLIDPNDLKPRIVAAVEARTRGSLRIDGELQWSLFPSLGVNVHQIEFRLPEDTEAPFAALERASLAVRLLPLLRLSVQADGLEVSGLRLNLRTDAKGKGNWASILRDAGGVQTAENAAAGGVQVAPLAVDISELRIADSAVEFSDAADGSHYLLEDFNLDSNDITLDGDQFPLELRFRVAVSDPELTSDLRLTTRLRADAAGQRYEFEDLAIDLDLSGTPFSGKQVAVGIQSDGVYDGAEHKAEWRDVELELAKTLHAKLALTATGLDARPQFTGSIEVQPVDAHALLAALGREPMRLRSEQALRAIGFKAQIDGPPDSLMFNPAELALDATRLRGKLGIANLTRSEYLIELQGDSIDLDAYAAPDEGGASAPASEAGAALLPVAALRDLGFKAMLGFANINAAGAKLSDFSLTANGTKGRVDLTRLNARLYGGAIEMSGTLDARQDTPVVTTKAHLKGVDLQTMLKDVAELDTVSGTARFDAQFQSTGTTTKALESALDGSLVFGVDNAVFARLNADQVACEAIAGVRGKVLTSQNWPPTTTFKRIGGTFRFDDGVGTNDDFAAELENMQVSGKGSIDLPGEAIDYRVALRISGDLSEPGVDGATSACAINPKYRDIGWPMRCKGRLSDPPGDLCGVDGEAIGKVAAQLLAAEAKSKLAGKLSGLLGGESPEESTPPQEQPAESQDLKSVLKKGLFDRLRQP